MTRSSCYTLIVDLDVGKVVILATKKGIVDLASHLLGTRQKTSTQLGMKVTLIFYSDNVLQKMNK